MRFYVDIEDASGNKLGTGPITSATGWTVRALMDGAGDWSFDAPLADVKLAQALPRRYAHIYALMSSGYTWMGGGPIDSIRTDIGDDGIVYATVSGGDLLRELAWRTVGNLEISDGAGGPMTHAQAVAAVAAFAPSGWTITADSAPGHDEIYGQFGGESVLAALATVAERSRSHLVLTGRRTLSFVSATSSSGVHAVAADDDLGAGQCAIGALGVESSSFDLYSRIIPLGAGQGLAALTLLATTRTAGTGYTLSTSANYLRNDAVETEYGRCELTVPFKDISPISSTTADVQSAANMLYDAALAWLDDHAAPIVTYRMSVTECPTLLTPMQTIRVSYYDPSQNLSIANDLIILGVDRAGDANGVRTAGLTVATSDQWPDSDIDALVSGVASGNIYQAHPQQNANDLVIPYTEPVDEDEEARFWWRFDDHVTQVVRVVFDFEIRPMESTVKTVALEQSTGGTITTDFAGDSGAESAANSGTPSVADTGNASTTTTSGQTGGTTTDSGGTGSTDSGGTANTGSGGTANTGSGGTASTDSGGSGNTGSGGTASTDSGGSGDTGSAGGGDTGSAGSGSTSSDGSGTTSMDGGGNTGSGGSGSTDSGGSGNTGSGGTASTDSGGSGNTGSASGTGYSSGTHQHGIDVFAISNPSGSPVYLYSTGGNYYFGAPNLGSAVEAKTKYDFGHTHSISSHSHTVSAHTHTIAAHSHTIAAHSHTMAAHTHTISAHTHTVSAHTHTVSAHTHTVGAHTHTVSAHTHTIAAHTHTIAAHTHTIATHTHTIATHTHTIATHTHTMAAHSHTLSQHTHGIAHTHSIGHTHDISHEHVFTPSVTTIYGIFRDVAGNTFVLADLEYSVDGATWYGFAVGINGFTSLGSDRYRVDLTALLQDATTLRPLNSNNLLRVQRKSTGATGKTATIKGQLGVRTIIQALALT